MAKTTTYNQTIKGSTSAANSQKRAADLLDRLIKARREGASKLGAQYKNAKARNLATRQSIVGDLLNGFNTAKEGYDRSNKDAESNLGTTASSSMLNRAREGSNAMSELSNMQAGETDRIKGMAASIRGLKANLDSGANDYANAITSINNSIGDLNSSVTANINNALREENSNNASAFGEYTSGQQQAMSDLVDLYGQQGAAYEAQAEALASKNSKTTSTGKDNITTTQKDTTIYGSGGNAAIRNAQDSFGYSALAADKLADLQGEFYSVPIMSIDKMNSMESDPARRFAEAELKKNLSNLDNLENRGTLRKLAGPEGSLLRKATA